MPATSKVTKAPPRPAPREPADAARRREWTARFRTLDEVPLTLTLEEVCAVYRRARSTVLRDVRAGVFNPAPFDRRPYRWRKEDIERDLEQKSAAAQERVRTAMITTQREQRRKRRA